MYDTLIGKQRGLVFPVMCNGHVRIDYSDNVPSTSDNQAYGIFSHEGNFTFESILTPYDINGFGQYSASAVSTNTTTTSTQKVMPTAGEANKTNTDFQSNVYIPLETRLTHEMNIFSSTNFTISLVNSTLHNENQPAEYKIRVTIKLGSDQTVTTDRAVITATSGFGWFYTADTLEGFDKNGRVTHVVGGVTNGTNSAETIPVASTAKFHEDQEVFIRDGFNFTSLGTISSLASSPNRIILNTAPSSSISSSTNIFIPAFKDSIYINNQFHIACVYNEASKEIRIFLDGILVKKQTISTSNTFSMAQEDYFIGASSNNGTGAGSATANKQFMGELHEMSMIRTIKKQFFVNNLLPNLDDTLFYFRFEEVDI